VKLLDGHFFGIDQFLTEIVELKPAHHIGDLIERPVSPPNDRLTSRRRCHVRGRRGRRGNRRTPGASSFQDEAQAEDDRAQRCILQNNAPMRSSGVLSKPMSHSRNSQ